MKMNSDGSELIFWKPRKGKTTLNGDIKFWRDDLNGNRVPVLEVRMEEKIYHVCAPSHTALLPYYDEMNISDSVFINCIRIGGEDAGKGRKTSYLYEVFIKKGNIPEGQQTTQDDDLPF